MQMQQWNSGTTVVIQYFQRILYSTSSLLSEIDTVDSLDGLVECVDQIKVHCNFEKYVCPVGLGPGVIACFYRGESSCHCFEISTIVRSENGEIPGMVENLS